MILTEPRSGVPRGALALAGLLLVCVLGGTVIGGSGVGIPAESSLALASGPAGPFLYVNSASFGTSFGLTVTAGDTVIVGALDANGNGGTPAGTLSPDWGVIQNDSGYVSLWNSVPVATGTDTISFPHDPSNTEGWGVVLPPDYDSVIASGHSALGIGTTVSFSPSSQSVATLAVYLTGSSAAPACDTSGGANWRFACPNNGYWYDSGFSRNVTAGSSPVLGANSSGFISAAAWAELVVPTATIIPSVLSVVGTGIATLAAAWTPVTNLSVVNYTLEWGTSYGSYPNHISEGTSLHATVSGLTANTTYWVIVRSWSGTSNAGPYSNVAPAQTASVTPLTKPVATFPIVSVVATGYAMITVAWAAPANVSVVNYTLEWGTSYGSYPNQASEGTSLTATLTGLAVNTTYWLIVQSWTGLTDRGPVSNAAPAQTWALAPPTPIIPPAAAVAIPWWDVFYLAVILVAILVGVVWYRRRQAEEEGRVEPIR